MALTVNNNIAALNAYRNLSTTQNSLNSSLEKLSSGYRINKAADDAAGLSISEGLRSQIGGLTVAVRNAQDGISVAQTAEGALTEVTDMLQRMNDLAVQYNNGTQNTDSQAALQAEFDALSTEITRIKDNTTFNGVTLFGAAADLDFQTGYSSSDVISIDSATALADFTAGTAMSAIDITDSDTLQAAVTEISTQRGALGAIQNRFEHTISNVNVEIENLTASESRIRDTDMASEMVDFTSAQILSQAGTAMLAQAKSIPQGVLSLLQ
ncbi:flagellin N-terminal helical domain-containing protein [Demequina salsinemoris]|uniref:flagellin N-terminal helical domain-containing protein n=1 Tax=Demequina salsinemoris TaxID=577470 RepID=UPI000782C395|nr:flagellin [Demequina salsinemoris]